MSNPDIGNVGLKSHYHFECWHLVHEDQSHCPKPDTCPREHTEQLRWTDGFNNTVVTVGLNKILDAAFKTGLASPAWYVGLVDNASWSAYAAGDIMSSHTGWIEVTAYSESVRQTFTPGSIAAGSVDNSGAVATYNINATKTVRGAFLVDNSTKGGTTGTLYGVGDFSVSRAVISGDILRITLTLSATSA